MSAAAGPAAATSLAQLDSIVAGVQAAPSAGKAANAHAKSIVPTETKDVKWWPIIPAGHTAYTFYGVSSEQPGGVSAGAAKPAAKPAAAAATAAPAAAASSSSSSAPAGEKAAKPAKAAAAPKNAPRAAAAEVEPDQPDFTKLDIRVGQIVSAKRHPKPEVTSLYVEQIDVGEAEPRQIVSGLVKYIPLDVFSSAKCLVICNLKAAPLQGEMSNGMVLAASTGEGDARIVELIQPPAGSKPGDRIVMLEGDNDAFKPMLVVDPRKKDKKTNEPDNAWSRTAKTLKTNDAKEATWNGVRIGTKANGVATSATLANANIA